MSRSGLGNLGVMDSLDNGVWRCWYLCKRTNVQMPLLLPVLLYGCETLTLTRDLRRTLNSFWSEVSSENHWLSLVGICVQRAVSERDSNEICYLHSP